MAQWLQSYGHSIWRKIEVQESFQQDDYCHDAMDHWRQYFRIYITKENIKKTLHKNIRNCDFAWSKIFVRLKFQQENAQTSNFAYQHKIADLVTSPAYFNIPSKYVLPRLSKKYISSMIRIQGFFLYQLNQITKSTSDCQFIDEEML